TRAFKCFPTTTLVVWFLSPWKLKCRECDTEWILNVSHDLSEFNQLYHYCRVCGKNTYHDILELVEI
ncbi:MAG: hypothetical protein QW116_07610, partial [Zestosphaera sp.]